jgi:hypothetical protein
VLLSQPYELWENISSREDYNKLKEERCDFLWKAIERSIPDTYGPALAAGKAKFPYPKTEIPGLLCCGDSVFPGIGVPAVAVSGANAASSTVSVWEHLDMLKKLYRI